jgi:hypothetical protein
MLAKYIGALLMNPYNRWEPLYAESRDHDGLDRRDVGIDIFAVGRFAVIDPFASRSFSFLPLFG